MKVGPKSPSLSAPFWMGCPDTGEELPIMKKEREKVSDKSSLDDNDNKSGSSIIHLDHQLVLFASFLSVLLSSYQSSKVANL